jgi:PKD repeat protein
MPIIGNIINFTADVTRGYVPLVVSFTDTSTPSSTSWFWDFGDGNTSTDQSPTHTYTTPGEYTVSFENQAGIPKTDTITAVDITYLTSFSTSINGLEVSFTDTSSPTPSSWLWDFGDGNTSTDQNPVHTYSGPGVYNVSLTPGPVYVSSNVPDILNPAAASGRVNLRGVIITGYVKLC